MHLLALALKCYSRSVLNESYVLDFERIMQLASIGYSLSEITTILLDRILVMYEARMTI
jgi:hypothetical protein